MNYNPLAWKIDATNIRSIPYQTHQCFHNVDLPFPMSQMIRPQI